jgi:hypothetical protein
MEARKNIFYEFADMAASQIKKNFKNKTKQNRKGGIGPIKKIEIRKFKFIIRLFL